MRIDKTIGEKEIVAEIAERCKQYRISYPMTRDELAEKSFVSLRTIARFESGNDISLSNLVKLLTALELTENIDLLIPDSNNRPSSYIQGYTARKRAGKKKENKKEWKWGDET